MSPQNFKQFYAYYLTQHANKYCRALHVIGTSLGMLWFFSCLIVKNYQLLPLSLLFGYGGSWLGHFFFEKNKPAAFSRPLYSFMADFVMLYEIITFKRGITDDPNN